MDSILVLAEIVFKENFRKKVIHVFLAIALIIFLWANSFQVFSLGVQVKFLKDICMFSISFISLLITITASAGQLSSEIEQRTIYPLLSKPLHRWQVLLGKFLGACYIIYLNIFVLGAFFLAMLYKHEGYIDQTIAKAIFLVAIECGVLAALCLMFSTFFSTAANVCITFFLYIIGHVKFGYGDYLSEQYESPLVQEFIKLLQNPIFPPNLNYFNIQEAFIENIRISNWHLLMVTGYGLGLIIFFLLVANILLTRKDL